MSAGGLPKIGRCRSVPSGKVRPDRAWGQGKKGRNGVREGITEVRVEREARITNHGINDFYINDPWPVNQGAVYWEWFNELNPSFYNNHIKVKN
jgi:hypothetical protein